MAVIGFKTDKLSVEVREALARAPNKSEYIRRALEHYAGRKEYDVILKELEELKGLVGRLIKDGVTLSKGTDEGVVGSDNMKRKAEEELLESLKLF